MMKLTQLDREIDKYVEPTKKWLLDKGYIRRDSDLGGYQWTEEGLKWIMTQATKGARDV